MKLSVSTALFLALSGASTMAFVPQSIQRTSASTALNMAASEGSDRRSFVGQVRLADCWPSVTILGDVFRTCMPTAKGMAEAPDGYI